MKCHFDMIGICGRHSAQERNRDAVEKHSMQWFGLFAFLAEAIGIGWRPLEDTGFSRDEQEGMSMTCERASILQLFES